MSSLAIDLPPLHDYQYAITSSPAKIKFVCMGRKAGKTIMCGTVAVTAANRGGQVYVLAPDYKRTRAIWRFCERAVTPFTPKWVSINKADQIISFKASGGFIAFYSGENSQSLRGESASVVILDEAAFLDDVFDDVVMPLLADLDGDLYAVSTPNTTFNWFYTQFQFCKMDTSGRYAAFHAPSYINPSPSVQMHYEWAKRTSPTIKFEREWNAKFTANSAGVFENVEACMTATPQLQAVSGHTYCIGFDPARIHDGSVLTVFDITIQAFVYIAVMVNKSFDFQKDALRQLYDRFHPITILIERNGFGYNLIEDLGKLRLPVQGITMTLSVKNQIIDSLSIGYQLGNVSFIPHDLAKNELLAFAGTPLQSGLMKYGAPHGMTDDIVMSMAIAYYGGKQEPLQMGGTIPRMGPNAPGASKFYNPDGSMKKRGYVNPTK